MLSDSPDVRVVDFGAAKIIGSSRMTKTGIVFGTPHYMSPEQASGGPVDHRADIYALGIIMYEMFTGRVPFEADTYMGVLTQHMFVQPVPPSQVSDAAKELGALEQITLICLEKKPDDRFASMHDLVEALDRVVRVRDGGALEIAARLEMLPNKAPASVRYRMADELEPPTLEEMRIAIDSVPPSKHPLPWRWIGAGGGALLVVVVAASALFFRAPRERTPDLAVSTAMLPPPVVVTAPSAAPDPSPQPEASPPPSSVNSSASTASAAPRPPPRRAPIRRTVPPNTDDVGDPFESKR
jgi:serine/threonine-protein kinase